MSEPQILVPGHEATDAEIGKNMKSLVAKLVDNGWTIIQVGHSRAYFPPETYLSGDKEGQEHGEATNDYNWVDAFHKGRKRTLRACYTNDRFDVCFWNRRTVYWGELVDSGEMNELIKGTWDDKLPGEMWKIFKAERAAKNKQAAAEKAAAIAERKRVKEEAKNG